MLCLHAKKKYFFKLLLKYYNKMFTLRFSVFEDCRGLVVVCVCVSGPSGPRYDYRPGKCWNDVYYIIGYTICMFHLIFINLVGSFVSAVIYLRSDNLLLHYKGEEKIKQHLKIE